MRFLSIVKSAENQGPPPQALMDAMATLTEDSISSTGRGGKESARFGRCGSSPRDGARHERSQS
jgi:hypothetical protein